MKYNPSFIIYSLDRPDEPYTGKVPARSSEVKGIYKSSSERSFVASTYDLADVRALAYLYSQECILIVENGSCYLEYTRDGRLEYIGTWTEIDKLHAESLDAYTVYNNKYFAAIGE